MSLDRGKVPHRTRLALRLHGDLVAPCLVSPQDLSVGLLDGDDAIVETRLPGGSDNLPAYLYPALLGEVEPGIGGKTKPGRSSEVIAPAVSDRARHDRHQPSLPRGNGLAVVVLFEARVDELDPTEHAPIVADIM